MWSWIQFTVKQPKILSQTFFRESRLRRMSVADACSSREYRRAKSDNRTSLIDSRSEFISKRYLLHTQRVHSRYPWRLHFRSTCCGHCAQLYVAAENITKPCNFSDISFNELPRRDNNSGNS